MNNLGFYFHVTNYIVVGTFLIIFLEAFYSIYKKDGVYTLKGTTGNVLGALVMKLIVENFGVIMYVGYLIYFEKRLPNIENIQSYGLLSYLICLVITDFTFYWYHRAHHYFRFLWTMHFIHHSDNKLNLSTSYRMSWIEKLYNLVVIIPAVLLGFDPYFVILCFYFTSVYQFFIHSQYIKYPHFLNYLFITPNNHIVHHVQAFEKNGMNFGIIFSTWDRIFGTYSEKVNEKKFGLKNYVQDDFLGMQIDPLVDYFKELKVKFKKYANRS